MDRLMGIKSKQTRIGWILWFILWPILFGYTISSIATASGQIEAFSAAAGRVHSIETDFSQEKYLPILAAPLVSTGRFHFRAPDALRWEYTAPVKSVLNSFKGKTDRYLASEDGALVSAGSGASFMDVILEEISNWMTGRFDRNPMFDLFAGDGDTIVLRPKNESVASMISRIELIPSQTPGIVSEVVIFESPESYTRIRFLHPVINMGIPDTVFTEAP